MSYIRIEKPRPHTTVIVMDRPERMNSIYVRLTTQNFEVATRARKEGRKPEFKD